MVPKERPKRSENLVQNEVESYHEIDDDFEPILGRIWDRFWSKNGPKANHQVSNDKTHVELIEEAETC